LKRLQRKSRGRKGKVWGSANDGPDERGSQGKGEGESSSFDGGGKEGAWGKKKRRANGAAERERSGT